MNAASHLTIVRGPWMCFSDLSEWSLLTDEVFTAFCLSAREVFLGLLMTTLDGAACWCRLLVLLLLLRFPDDFDAGWGLGSFTWGCWGTWGCWVGCSCWLLFREPLIRGDFAILCLLKVSSHLLHTAGVTKTWLMLSVRQSNLQPSCCLASSAWPLAVVCFDICADFTGKGGDDDEDFFCCWAITLSESLSASRCELFTGLFPSVLDSCCLDCSSFRAFCSA